MKNFIYILGFIFIILSCSTQNQSSNIAQDITFEQDEEEYDLIVSDPDYEIYLKTIAQPMNHYSESFYRSKNQFYVIEWNLRHNNPLRYNPNIYTSYISYDPNIEYGLNFEFKLYNFFKFVEWKYKISLDF